MVIWEAQITLPFVVAPSRYQPSHYPDYKLKDKEMDPANGW